MTGTTNTRTTALSIQPTTENELLLLSALHESEAQVQRIEVYAFELQASNILNEAYADGGGVKPPLRSLEGNAGGGVRQWEKQARKR